MNKFRMAKAGINVNEAIERLCGDVEMYEKMLVQYLDCTYIDELKKHIEENDTKAAFQSAHALKGVAGNLSLTKIYNAVFPIVEKLRVDDINVNDDMPALEEANEKVINAIKDMIS